MNSMHRGIVLRVPTPYQHKIALFDSAQGKIYALRDARLTALMHGELISYRLERWKHLYRLCDVEALQLPAAWVREDILFMHHLLEVAYFFLPEESCASLLFQLCHLLYDNSHAVVLEHALLKKIFLGKFFALLGVYPDQAFETNEQLFHLFSRPGIAISDELCNHMQSIEELHKKLEGWLLGCIQTHPHANTFTTMHFLYAQTI